MINPGDKGEEKMVKIGGDLSSNSKIFLLGLIKICLV